MKLNKNILFLLDIFYFILLFIFVLNKFFPLAYNGVGLDSNVTFNVESLSEYTILVLKVIALRKILVTLFSFLLCCIIDFNFTSKILNIFKIKKYIKLIICFSISIEIVLYIILKLPYYALL